MSTDVGKSAKHMGKTHPRDAKKLDPREPPPATFHEVREKTKTRKRFGFEYQRRTASWDSDVKDRRWGRWEQRTHWTWYETAKQRDQAMRVYRGISPTYEEIRDKTPIERD